MRRNDLVLANAGTAEEPMEPRRQRSAWQLWTELATEDALMAASEADKARMVERHKLVVNIIDVNSQQLRCESAIAGLDIERACALRDAASLAAAGDGKSVIAALDKKMAALSDESQRLATQREFLNAALSEFDAVAGGEDDAASRSSGVN